MIRLNVVRDKQKYNALNWEDMTYIITVCLTVTIATFIVVISVGAFRSYDKQLEEYN